VHTSETSDLLIREYTESTLQNKSKIIFQPMKDKITTV